jgi:hypothetical protein
VTGRDTFFFDREEWTLRTGAGDVPMESLQTSCAQVVDVLSAAVREERKLLADGRSALPAMRVPQAVHDDWDAR